MAHKGKLGPVAFRRDFNLNVDTNTYGWWRRYLLSITLVPQGIASVLGGKTFDCGPDTNPELRSLAWESVFTQYGVAKYQCQLKCSIQLDNETYFKEGAIIVLNQGIIWHWHYHEIDNRRPGFVQTLIPITDFWSDDWFDSEPQGRSLFTNGKNWQQPPPH